MEQQRKPAAGDLYCHFKGNLYEVITLAVHSETEEEMVVYRQRYGEFNTYVRPLSMFLSEVDHEKYPEVKQKYRFELISQGTPVEEVEKQDTQVSPEDVQEPSDTQEETAEPENLLYAFLDAPTLKEKLAVLESRKEDPDNLAITNMAVSVDIVIEDGPVEERLEELIDCLKTMAHFECTRLR